MIYPNYDKLRVLIVDDFDNFRVSVTRMLQGLGVMNIDVAINGQHAIKHCKHRSYDLILCDFNLGMGKNGLQVLEQLKHEQMILHTNLFALITAETGRSTVLAVNEYEPDAYLMKPITGRALQTRIDRLLMRRESLMPALHALDEGKPDTAIVFLQGLVLEAGRYVADAQKLLGQLYVQEGGYELAVALYQSVLADHEVDWAKVGLAEALQNNGDWQDARSLLTDLVKENPLCTKAYQALDVDYKQHQDMIAMQKNLQAAVSVSPESRNFQKQLATVASANNDLVVASQAYRKTVRLSNNSCHDDVSHHLDFGRTTVALMASDEASGGREMLRDVLVGMDSLEKKFDLTADQFLQSQLICCQAYKTQGNTKKAKEILREVEVRQNGKRSDFDTELDKIHVLQALGEKKLADEAIDELIRCYEHDQEALQKLDSLLDEPISDVNKQRVKSINREGIDFYKNKKYEEAVECFTQAKRLFPNHIGIHLNLVQALSGHIKTYGFNTERMTQCVAALKHVEPKLNPSHSQFDRFRQLREACQKIESNSKQNVL